MHWMTGGTANLAVSAATCRRARRARHRPGQKVSYTRKPEFDRDSALRRPRAQAARKKRRRCPLPPIAKQAERGVYARLRRFIVRKRLTQGSRRGQSSTLTQAAGAGKTQSMPRQYESNIAAPIYYVMNRGVRREPIFKSDLDCQRFLRRIGKTLKADPNKVRIARRLRGETTVTLKWIADRLRMRKWTYVSNNLTKASRQCTTP